MPLARRANKKIVAAKPTIDAIKGIKPWDSITNGRADKTNGRVATQIIFSIASLGLSTIFDLCLPETSRIELIAFPIITDEIALMNIVNKYW